MAISKTSPEFVYVYSSSISLLDVINALAIEKNKQSLTPQAENGNQSTQDPSLTLLLYRATKLLKDQIIQCKGIFIYPASINDFKLATAKNIVPSDLYSLDLATRTPTSANVMVVNLFG